MYSGIVWSLRNVFDKWSRSYFNLNKFQKHMMNFARAVRGTLTRSAILREVDSQSEIELGRHLDPAEKSSLFSRFLPEIVADKIQQVLAKRNIDFFHNYFFLSLVMGLKSLCCSCLRGLSWNATFHQMQHRGMETASYMVRYIFLKCLCSFTVPLSHFWWNSK